MKRLSEFNDIHTHNIHAGSDSIINLPWGDAVPSTGYFSVGVHPWDTENIDDSYIAELDAIAQLDNVVAIGETGLDALRGASLSRQEQIFREHVRISEKHRKPLIIHAVRTLADILRLRRELKPTQQWVIHGFRGKPATARQLISQGIDISLGKKYHPAMPDGIDSSHIYNESDMDY